MSRYGILNFSTDTEVESKIIHDEHIHCYQCCHEDDLPDSISGLEACMVWHEITLSKKTLDRMKKCKIIVCVGVGYNNIDIKYAGQLGIVVVNIPDYGTNDVADHTLALLLSMCRKINVYNSKLLENPVDNWNPGIGGEIRRITGTILGIAGLGRIGSAVAIRAKSFGMSISFYDPYIPDGYDKVLNVNRCSSLNELFETSDYVSVHTPLTAETKYFINAGVINNCKEGLTLINTARGAIIDLDAVYVALKENRLKAFASDVMPDEPPDENHPFFISYRNKESWIDGRVILTPHAAFYAVESRYEMRIKSAQQMQNAVKGIPVRNCVNRDYLINERCNVYV